MASPTISAADGDELLSPAEVPLRSAVGLPIDGDTVCVLTDRVTEVVPSARDVAAVPGAPPSVIGLINIRGTTVTLLDTRRLLGLSPLQAHPFALLAELDGEPIALAASGIPFLMAVGLPMNDGEQPGIADVRLGESGEPVGVLDIERLIREGLPR